MNSNKYDVIIIGAGIGGLTAGAILARNGKKVLVLEKNPVVGGYAVNFKRKGFEFDAAIHLINGCDVKGRTYNILKQCGVSNEVKFLKSKNLYRAIFPNHDLNIPQSDLARYIHILGNNFPTEKKGIDVFFKKAQLIYGSIYRFDKYGELSPEFIQSVNTVCSDFISNYLKSPELKAIIFQLWPYFGLPASKLPNFYFCYPWLNYFKSGGFYPLGGIKTLNGALAKAIAHNNGEVVNNREVKTIIVKNDTALGVALTSGEEYYAEIIISNICPRNTFYDLIEKDRVPTVFIEKIATMRPSISVFQVYLGLDIDLKKLGIKEYEIFINSKYDIEKQYNESLENNIAEAPIGVTIYSNLDSRFSPKNKSSIAIAMFSNYDFWARLSKMEYKIMKKRFEELLIKRAEVILFSLSKHIEVCDSATPLTMERYTGSYKGAIYGWEQNVSQSGIMRLDRNTPIRNLYLVGAWTRPGAGVAGVMYSGKSVANDILGIKRRW